ncbi:MAG: hypothetical protein KatS3mg083_141 [Candidatus Dojkabacteria bacterium]|nr:MAG: hypothetical protein KatS3mg083_141 [Candidatus Dojkabacteria bacterium]
MNYTEKIIKTIDNIYTVNKTAPDKIVPWLIAPTGTGKSYIAKLYAERYKARLVTLILASKSEYEILGIAEINDRKTIWTEPEWLHPNERCVYFFDEIDKAHPNLIATILTFITTGQIHDMKVHPESIIIIASQPISEFEFQGDDKYAATMQALRARSVFIDYDQAKVFNTIYSLSVQDRSTMEKAINNQYKIPLAKELNVRQTLWLNYAYKCLEFDEYSDLVKGIYVQELHEFLRGLFSRYEPFNTKENTAAQMIMDCKDRLLAKTTILERRSSFGVSYNEILAQYGIRENNQFPRILFAVQFQGVFDVDLLKRGAYKSYENIRA